MSRPTVFLKPRKALPFFNHHPWLFASAIDHVEGQPQVGDWTTVRAKDGQFIGNGLWNPESHIRVRLYSWSEDEDLSDEFFCRKIATAISQRSGFSIPSNARRLVFSEADGISGLTVDQYGDYVLIQMTSKALAQRQGAIVETLIQQTGAAGVWLRTEKGIRAAEGLEQVDGLIAGLAPPRPLFIEENGLKYALDVTEGQKTGFFLDQRDNRRRVADFAANRDVLDVCCYSGGFSLNSLLNGAARSVTAVDVSQSAIALAKANSELNGVSDRMQFIVQDCYKALEEFAAAEKKFGLVILDPPKLARNRNSLETALRGYYSLNKLACEVLEPGGILVTCSCSGLVTKDLFMETLSRVSLHTGRSIQILESRGAAADHPTSVHCLDTDYLKCLICRVA